MQKRILTQKVMEEILWAYVKAEYQPSEETFQFLASVSQEELSDSGVRNRYTEFYEEFEEDNSTPLDPIAPIIG